ncbi:hypothetical protein [Cohnella sp. JJ-181]|uniref:hypothetical protein n=1 Tax=Cohnella rhizoplanae TaxID=2974897 RepID=UPI0022FF614A|nr:hypothetical protein [Cohnella sp. JJ-181]CAI6024410.1 Protein csk22 [Cohnella sp. JJ-181]
MNQTAQFAVPLLLIAFFLYRRIRRTVGFQLLRPRRLQIRVGLFSVVGLVLIATGFMHPVVFAGDAVGLALGGLLAWFAIRHSVVERRTDGLYYRTHVVIESLVIALFVGRIAYRFLFAMPAATQTADAFGGAGALQQYGRDPWTAAILFILIAYYAGYYLYVLRAVPKRAAQS